MANLIEYQMDLLPFDVIDAAIANNVEVFEKNATAIAAIDVQYADSFLMSVYIDFFHRFTKPKNGVPQSMKTVMVDAFNILIANGLRLSECYHWRTQMIVEANLQGDVCMLEWLKQNLLTHYSGDELRIHTHFLKVAREYTYIHADSLQWFIDNISKDKQSYKHLHRHSVVDGDSHLAEMIDRL